jgi:hypothetical protein
MTADHAPHAAAPPKPGASAKVDRERVLRYPDLRERLCEALGYKDARQWTGYIPAASDGQQLNHSPTRAAFWEIATEAYERELAGGWTPPLDLDEQPSNGDT